jgi:hypothetical protein
MKYSILLSFLILSCAAFSTPEERKRKRINRMQDDAVVKIIKEAIVLEAKKRDIFLTPDQVDEIYNKVTMSKTMSKL